MKILSVLLLFFSLSVYSQIPAGYYDNAIGLTGDSLKDALNDIIDGHTEYSYTSSGTDTWDILKQADKDPDSSNNVIGIYSGFSMDGPKEYDSGKGWSREHVWAKSRGNFSTSRGIGTDLHNLRAEDVSTNSARNNRNFDTADTKYKDVSGNYSGTIDSKTSTSKWVWEPRDEVKGDIARAILYMTVRYEGENGELDLELIDSLLPSSDKRALHGRASTLIDWHLADTVSDAERARNDTIYNYQKNRNPFVDHPEYVCEIYGKYCPVTTQIVELISEFEFAVYPNPSSSHVTIEFEGNPIKNVSVFDLQGKRVFEKEVLQDKIDLDLSSYNKGGYIIRVETYSGEISEHLQIIN